MDARGNNSGYGYDDGPQPHYQPQRHTPPTKPKTSRGALIGTGLGSLILGIIIGSASAKSSTSAPAASTIPATITVTVTVPASAAATQPQAAHTTTAAKPSPAKAAAPATVLTVKGNGIKDTASFTVTDDWTIKYTYDCTKFGFQGNFQVTVDNNMGMTEANALGKSGADSSVVHGNGGKHYLSVNSECDWTITVVNGDSG